MPWPRFPDWKRDLFLTHQEERERAERAEEMLEQLTRSLAQEKSTSTALQAERAALERLQVCFGFWLNFQFWQEPQHVTASCCMSLRTLPFVI